jgi:hypothetical protein
MRTQRNGMTDHAATLATMRVCREAMVKVLIAYNARRRVYREAQWLVVDITGHRELFHAKGHG